MKLILAAFIKLFVNLHQLMLVIIGIPHLQKKLVLILIFKNLFKDEMWKYQLVIDCWGIIMIIFRYVRPLQI